MCYLFQHSLVNPRDDSLTHHPPIATRMNIDPIPCPPFQRCFSVGERSQPELSPYRPELQKRWSYCEYLEGDCPVNIEDKGQDQSFCESLLHSHGRTSVNSGRACIPERDKGREYTVLSALVSCYRLRNYAAGWNPSHPLIGVTRK